MPAAAPDTNEVRPSAAAAPVSLAAGADKYEKGMRRLAGNPSTTQPLTDQEVANANTAIVTDQSAAKASQSSEVSPSTSSSALFGASTSGAAVTAGAVGSLAAGADSYEKGLRRLVGRPSMSQALPGGNETATEAPAVAAEAAQQEPGSDAGASSGSGSTWLKSLGKASAAAPTGGTAAEDVPLSEQPVAPTAPALERSSPASSSPRPDELRSRTQELGTSAASTCELSSQHLTLFFRLGLRDEHPESQVDSVSAAFLAWCELTSCVLSPQPSRLLAQVSARSSPLRLQRARLSML